MGKAKIKNIVIAEVIVEASALEVTETPVEASAPEVTEAPAEVIIEVLEVKVPKVSLVSRIINVMNENHDKSMKETVDIMVATLPLNPERALASARSYYQELVAADRALGRVEPQVRSFTPKASKVAKVPVTLAAVLGPEAVEAIVSGMAEKRAKIIADNQARMDKNKAKLDALALPAEEHPEALAI